MNQRQEMYHTMNLMVASVLMTYGFKLITFTHISREDGRESKEFWFEGTSATCSLKAEQVAYYATKGADELTEKDPENPILWMRGAMTNRNTLIEIVKKTPRMVEISTIHGRTALIAETASDETRRAVADML